MKYCIKRRKIACSHFKNSSQKETPEIDSKDQDRTQTRGARAVVRAGSTTTILYRFPPGLFRRDANRCQDKTSHSDEVVVLLTMVRATRRRCPLQTETLRGNLLVRNSSGSYGTFDESRGTTGTLPLGGLFSYASRYRSAGSCGNRCRRYFFRDVAGSRLCTHRRNAQWKFDPRRRSLDFRSSHSPSSTAT